MTEKIRHKGRLAQMRIYLGKFLRMFVYQSDWKILPMGAIITAVVTFVVGSNLFVTQEGTLTGAFALICVCIWNGFFNSIQTVCRERGIIKREHRAGLHMSAYVAAQVIYQFLLCVAQTGITLLICRLTGVRFPEVGVVTPWGMLDVGITILLVTYASDMMALMISCIVRTTTTAMTVMPFMLMFQLVFSGGFFALSGFAQKLTVLTISRWGLNGLCSVGRYNERPMVTLWNTIYSFRNVEIMGQQPLQELINRYYREDLRDQFLAWSGLHHQNASYASTVSNVMLNWSALVVLTLVFIVLAVLALEFIDRDQR